MSGPVGRRARRQNMPARRASVETLLASRGLDDDDRARLTDLAIVLMSSVVQQAFRDYLGAGPDVAADRVTWATHGDADSLDFRSAVGMWAVGLPPARRPGERTFASEFDALGGNPANVYCAAPDSRPAVGLWLAVRGDAAARQDLEELAELAVDSANTTGIYLVTAGGVIVEPRQAQLAARLLNVPPNDVAAALKDHWEAIRAGELSSDDLREALNLEATGDEPAGGLSGGIPTPPTCS